MKNDPVLNKKYNYPTDVESIWDGLISSIGVLFLIIAVLVFGNSTATLGLIFLIIGLLILFLVQINKKLRYSNRTQRSILLEVQKLNKYLQQREQNNNHTKD